MSRSSIVCRPRVHSSVVCSIVFLVNPVRRYQRCVAPQNSVSFVIILGLSRGYLSKQTPFDPVGFLS